MSPAFGPRSQTIPGWCVMRELSGRERDTELANRMRLFFLALRPVRRLVDRGFEVSFDSHDRQIAAVRALLDGPEYENVWHQCPALAYVIDHPDGRVLYETGISETAHEEWPAAWLAGNLAPWLFLGFAFAAFDLVVHAVVEPALAEPAVIATLVTVVRGVAAREEEIDALPGQIASGEVTMADVFDIAEKAVDEGVVEEGYGFWHRPVNGGDFLYFYAGMGGEVVNEEGNLVFDQAAALRVFEMLQDARDRGIMNGSHLGIEWPDWHTTVAPAEQALFALGGTWFWGDWAVNYVADSGGEDYLWENMGFALVPAMDSGEPITVTHPLGYMISSSSEHPDVAMALLAAITTPEANNRHAIGSAHLGILNAQLDSAEYQESEFLAAAHPMLDYAVFLPNHPNWGAWSEAFWTGIEAVESGELNAQAALDVVVDRLQNEVEGIEIR